MFNDVTGHDSIEVGCRDLSNIRRGKFRVRMPLPCQRDGSGVDIDAQRLALQRGQPCRKLARVAPNVEDAPARLRRE